MKTKILYPLFAFIAIICSCERELEIDLPNTPPQIVINSRLFQDSTFSVNVFRTSLINENHTNLWYVDTARVSVYNNNEWIENLTLNSRGNYIGTHCTKANADYRLEVAVKGYSTATVSTKTLDKVPIIRLDSIGPFVDAEAQEKFFNFAIRFKDNSHTKDYYMLDFSEYTAVGSEISRIFSKDPAIEIGGDGYIYPGEEIKYYSNFYFSDELFNGQEYALSICVPQYKVNEGFTVNLSHISPEQFKYAQTIDAYNESTGDQMSLFFQAVQVYGNVENGLGILGTFSSYTQRYEYEYPVK